MGENRRKRQGLKGKKRSEKRKAGTALCLFIGKKHY
jgi:hypothetical protein